MVTAEKVTVTRTAWSKVVRDDLSAVCNSTALDAVYRDAVLNRCALWDVTDNLGEHYGTIVTYVDDMADGTRQLDIRYTGGQWMKTIKAAAPFLEAYARHTGCDFARVHSVRPGVTKVLEAYDFMQVETVLLKRIGG